MDAAAENQKPQCGGGAGTGDAYDLPLHVAGLFLVMLASILGAGFPVAAKKIKWLNVPPKVFFACKHFGTGVLIATAFVHLLPTAFGSLMDPCLPDLFTKLYPPMPGVIMMGSMFALFVIEMYLNAKTGGHSHGGPTGSDFNSHSHDHGHGHAVAHAAPAPMAAPQRPVRPYQESFDFGAQEDRDYEKMMQQKMDEERSRQDNPYARDDAMQRSEMPAWFVVFYEQYVRQRMEMVNALNANRMPAAAALPSYDEKDVAVTNAESYFDEEGQSVDPQVFKKMSANITLLEGGILFHSVFVGMTISITVDGFVILLVAILFHQMFEGLGLGARIAAVPYPKGTWRPWILVIAFGMTCPIGQAIGLLTRNTYDPESAFGLIIVGVFNAISSGLLIYAALVDLLAEDFLSEEAQRLMNKKDRIHAFLWVLLGAIGMSVVGAFA